MFSCCLWLARFAFPGPLVEVFVKQGATEASVKYRKRKRSEQGMDLFESTSVKRRVPTDDPMEIRRETIRAVASKVESDDFQQMLSGLHLIQREKISVQEAEEHLIRSKVEEMKNSKFMSLKNIAGKVIRTWLG